MSYQDAIPYIVKLAENLKKEGFSTTFSWEEGVLRYHLVPLNPITCTSRWLTGVVNIYGARQPEVRDKHWELRWYLNPINPDGSFDLEIFNSDRSAWLEDQTAAIAQLFHIGMYSKPVEPNSQVLELSQLLKVYRTVEEVIQDYVVWSSTVIDGELDLPTLTCDRHDHAFGLCCSNHLRLMAQRSIFNDWFMFFADESVQNEHPITYDRKMSQPPSTDELLTMLTQITTYKASNQEWLEGYFLRLEHIHLHRWEAPTHECASSLYTRYLCCPMHLTLNVMFTVMSPWSEKLDMQYHISLMKDEPGMPSPGLMSDAWVEILICLNELNRTTIHFPFYWSKVDVPSYIKP